MSLKENILEQLNINIGTDISGQALAEKFGVSRNAVWKAIKSLKDDGYEITSVTNKGYCLSAKNDIISPEKISKLFDDTKLPVYYYDTIDSTNSQAKRLLLNENHEDQFVVIANEQTNGRGRQGRQFYSPKGSGIYFTVVTSPNTSIDNIISITSYTAVCIASAIRSLTAKNAMIKWVNDIYIDNKKVCGILTEAVSDFESGTVNYILTGVGINILSNDFPSDIKKNVGIINPDHPVKNELIATIVNNILKHKFSDNSYIDEYKKYSLVLGKDIEYIKNNEKHFATAIDIDENGGLIIKEDNKTEVLRSGEITVRLK